jgi:hypothetical protein
VTQSGRERLERLERRCHEQIALPNWQRTNNAYVGALRTPVFANSQSLK